MVMLTPIVQIEVRNNEKKKEDKTLENRLTNQTLRKVNESLGQKYTLKNKNFDLTSEELTQLELFFKKLDLYERVLPEVALPEFLTPDSIPEKYIMAVFINGWYDPNFKPYHNQLQSARSDAILVNAPALVSTGSRILIADVNTKKILYYNEIKMRRTDPRISEDIENLVADIIRPIYYK